MEKPTWGHCLWGIRNEDDADPLTQGRFIWADDCCEEFEARHGVAAAHVTTE